MSFAKAEELTTLAQAREAFTELLAAHEGAIAAHAAKLAEQADAQSVQEAVHQTALAEAQALREDLATANGLLDEAARDKVALTAKIAEAEAEKELLSSELAGSLEKIKDLDARTRQLEAQAKSAEAKAAEICASVGVEPAQVTPGGEPRQTSLLEQMRSIGNPAEQMAFFRKHKESILRGQ
jgi:chromosome segregation ATPase